MTTTYRRHPAEVTSDRLLDAHKRYTSRLTVYELRAIGTVRSALMRIAEEAEDERADREDNGNSEPA